jgi:16S rRNA processing protein RimM
MELIEIAVIVKTHGLKGDVIVKSLADQKGAWLKAGQLLYLSEEITLTIKEAKPHKKDFLVTFEGIISINDITQHVRSVLYIPKDSLEPLDENEFYFDDLIGLTAYFSNGKKGLVKDVLRLPHGEILEIEVDGYFVKVPFVNEWVKDIDLEAKKITIQEVEGLL